MHNNLNLPPKAEFNTREELESYLKYFALSNGYDLSVARSTKNKNFTLNCDKGGTYQNNLNLEDNERVRHTGTMKSGCKFCIKGLCQDRLWSFWIQNKDHNHGKEDLMARRLSVEASLVIISNGIAGGTPKAAMLRDSNPDMPSSITGYQ
jgi:hypothetical protein